MPTITPELLRAYMDESLPDAEMTAVEKALRDDAAVQTMFRTLQAESDRGDHSLGAIWRRDRLTCARREDLVGYLLQAIDPALEAYLDFHIKIIGCPFCQANLDDLQKKQSETEETHQRRQRVVKSTAGILRSPMRP